jgi:hypothetical protein
VTGDLITGPGAGPGDADDESREQREALVPPPAPGRAPRSRRGGAMAAVGSTAAMKVVVMGLSGVLGIITSRMIIQQFGTDAYAQYGLLSTFPTLLPFADLGIAAIVINAVAGSWGGGAAAAGPRATAPAAQTQPPRAGRRRRPPPTTSSSGPS